MFKWFEGRIVTLPEEIGFRKNLLEASEFAAKTFYKLFNTQLTEEETTILYDQLLLAEIECEVIMIFLKPE